MYSLTEIFKNYQEQIQFFAYPPGFGGEKVVSLLTEMTDDYVPYVVYRNSTVNRTGVNGRKYWGGYTTTIIRKVDDLVRIINEEGQFIDSTELKLHLDSGKKFISIWHVYDPRMIYEFPSCSYVYAFTKDNHAYISKLAFMKIQLRTLEVEEVINHAKSIGDTISAEEMMFWKKVANAGGRRLIYSTHFRRFTKDIFGKDSIFDMDIDYLCSDEAVKLMIAGSQENQRFISEGSTIKGDDLTVLGDAIKYDRVSTISDYDIYNAKSVESIFGIKIKDHSVYESAMSNWKMKNDELLEQNKHLLPPLR